MSKISYGRPSESSGEAGKYIAWTLARTFWSPAVRTPNTQGIGLEVTGVETTNRGHVKVKERLETTAPGVWAVGDCAGSPHFTHIA